MYLRYGGENFCNPCVLQIRFTLSGWMGKQGKHSLPPSKSTACPCDCSDQTPIIDFCGAPIPGRKFAFEVFVYMPGLTVPSLEDNYVRLKHFNLEEEIL